jgi:TetR/AcrR family transcriptional regulator, regulator of biofilm formation and stress response
VPRVAIRPETHRASTLARREALLDAAVEVVAERGVGGATHREIAARAGVPLSTTSYFFASIDELVLEALRCFAARGIARLDAVADAIADERLSPEAAVERFAAALLAVPARETLAQFEAYLEAGRRPEVRAEAARVISAFERLAEAALAAAGAPRPRELAPALVALADGFALHRLAGPRGRDEARALADGLRALCAAALPPAEAGGGGGAGRRAAGRAARRAPSAAG